MNDKYFDPAQDHEWIHMTHHRIQGPFKNYAWGGGMNKRIELQSRDLLLSVYDTTPSENGKIHSVEFSVEK